MPAVCVLRGSRLFRFVFQKSRPKSKMPATSTKPKPDIEEPAPKKQKTAAQDADDSAVAFTSYTPAASTPAGASSDSGLDDPSVVAANDDTPVTLDMLGGKYPRILFYQPTDGGAARLLPFNPAEVAWSKPKRMDYGGHVVSLCVETSIDGTQVEVPLRLQLPVMRTSFGVNRNKKNERGGYTLDMSFYGMQKRPAVERLFLVLKMLDQRTVEVAKERKTEWFKGAQKYHDDVLQHFYKATTRARISNSTGRAWSPSLSLKCYQKAGRFEPELYADATETPQQLDLEEFGPNREGECLVQHTGLWFGDNSFTHGWKLVQARLKPSDAMTGYGMVATDDAAA